MSTQKNNCDEEPLSPEQIGVARLISIGRACESIAKETSVSIAEIRKWEQDIQFRCFLNQLQNEIVESGIREHTYMLSLLPEPQFARGYVAALDRLEKVSSLPTTPQAIMEADQAN